MKIVTEVVGVARHGGRLTVKLSPINLGGRVLLGVEHSLEVPDTVPYRHAYYVGRRVELTIEPR